MKFNIYTLGCKVNTYESNVIIDQLVNSGYEQVDMDIPADISIINTCTVTNAADSKSMKTIRHVIRNNPDAIVIVVGCFSQINPKKASMIEGVDIVLGNQHKSKIASYIEEYRKNKKQIVDVDDMKNACFETMKLNNFNKTRAFVKIQDGCNNFCSYCIIPYSRGDVRSKSREDVLDEVKTLIQNGHREIVLTGIHTGHYGSEFDDYTFADLLEELVQIKGLERLRISSIEITEITDRIIDLIQKYDVLVDHMHVPLQAGSNSILEAMNRKYDLTYFEQKLQALRHVRPMISISTDVIVGFPGETEEYFETTIETVRKFKFSKIHVFPYSRRHGTKADIMPNQIDENIKKERARKLIVVSKELEIDYMKQFIGKTLTFIPEMYKDGYVVGHTGNYLPIKTEGNPCDLNQDIQVEIKEISYPYAIAIRK